VCSPSFLSILYLDNLDIRRLYILIIEWRGIITDESRDLVKGTLEMLVPKTLALKPTHGYGIRARIEQISAGVFCVNPGSLLPDLSCLDRAERLKSEWQVSENNRRATYYARTARGLKVLENDGHPWDRQVAATGTVLHA
jgi:PadR family transcriptional regulator PadR